MRKEKPIAIYQYSIMYPENQPGPLFNHYKEANDFIKDGINASQARVRYFQGTIIKKVVNHVYLSNYEHVKVERVRSQRGKRLNIR